MVMEDLVGCYGCCFLIGNNCFHNSNHWTQIKDQNRKWRLMQIFLVYMPCIDLVRRTGSMVEGRIGDRALRPASLPILLNWRQVLFIRYAAKPVIGTLNPPMSKPLIVGMSVPGSSEVDGMMIVADEKGWLILRLTRERPCRRRT